MPGSKRIKRGERGISALGIVFAIGAVVVAVGLAILMSTDSQLKGASLGLVKRDNDWTVRSSVKLVEEAWKKYIGIQQVDATTYSGTVYDSMGIYSRDTGLIDGIQNAYEDNNQNYALLCMLYDTQHDTVDPNTADMPNSLIYQIDLTRDKPGFTNYENNLDKSDGVVYVARQESDETLTVANSVDNPDNNGSFDQIWNNLDGSGNRQFNAIVTVTPNGFPGYSADNVYFVYPVKFNITITVRTTHGGVTKNTTVTGLGACSFYVYRRSFAEYLVFADKFQTGPSGGTISIPKGFTYAGPVHTNGAIRFTGDPTGAEFMDAVSMGEKQAYWNGAQEDLEGYKDRISSNNCSPTFHKGFAKGVGTIECPTTDNLGDIPKAVLGGLNLTDAPTDTGVYLRTPGNTFNDISQDQLERGGIYIKGNVTSLTLSQGDQMQTYSIVQDNLNLSGATTPTTRYYTDQACTILATDQTGGTDALGRIVTQVTCITDKYTYTILSNYSAGETVWTKVTNYHDKTVVTKSTRTATNKNWSVGSPVTTNPTGTQNETFTYHDLIDVVQAPTGKPETPQTAIYVNGALGSGAAGTSNTPTGLSGTVDRDTELTICASGNITIAGNTIYERKDNPDSATADRLDDQGILGLISVGGRVQIDYSNPVGKNVNIDASIMAVDPTNGLLTALDYTSDLRSGGTVPNCNLYGGVIQKYYGAMGQLGTDGLPKNGYVRNFKYDKRLIASPPPLYPKQSACRMQVTNDTGDNTLQLVWNY